MGRKRASQGSQAQFTYDFGIAIAQSTVNKITRLTGVTLTLASAFYALKKSATEYVDTLRTNTLRFGGVLSTMREMERAQDRLIKGQSYFNVDNQLAGMNQLLAVGIKTGETFEWVNKAAHATGRSYAEFAADISSAIGGNMQSLVDMGLLTQRATRMFDKYQANTIMRQQAILNFVKSHKGLQNAIKNDFETIQDQMTRIRGIWSSFLHSILGKPNDPNSFYGQIVSSMKMVATALARNMEQIKRYGFIIGQTLGWVIRQIGHFVVWVGRQVKRSIDSVWKVTDNFQEQTRSMLVWLEFWKLRLIDFFNQYGDEIKGILKMLIAYKALKTVFVFSKAAIASAAAYSAALSGLFIRMRRIRSFVGGVSWWKALWLAILPRWAVKFLTRATVFLRTTLPKLLSNVKSIFIAIGNYLGGTLVGKAGAFIAKIGGAAGVVWTIWEAVDAVGKLIPSVGKFMDDRKAYLNDYFKSIRVSWTIAIDKLKFYWHDFSKWWGKNVGDPIINKWKEAKWGEFFAPIKQWWVDFINEVGALFRKTFGWAIDLYERAKWNWNNVNRQKEQKRQLDQANIDLKRTLQIADLIKQARARGYDTSKYYEMFPESVKNRLAAKRKAEEQKNAPPLRPTDEVSLAPGAPWRPTEEGFVPKNPMDYSQNVASPVINPIIEENKSKSDISKPTEDLGADVLVSPGAVQIIVQKGENIDEEKLARKIREVLEDMKRTNTLRRGE